MHRNTHIQIYKYQIYRRDGLLFQYVVRAKFWLGTRTLKNLNRRTKTLYLEIQNKHKNKNSQNYLIIIGTLGNVRF